MANEVVLTLKVDSDNAVTNIEQVEKAINETSNATKSMKAQLRELQMQLADMDPEDARFQELSRQAAQLKDTIDDTAQAIRDNAGNAFEGLSNNAATLGGRLLDLDFAGVGQSARGMANNIKNINVKLLTEEVGGAVKGFATLGKALLTNPIFLVGALIAGIILNFEKLNELMAMSYSNETKALELAKERTAQSQAQLDSIGEQENILRLQGMSERDILKLKIAQTEEVIANTRAQIEQQKMVLAAQIATEQRAKSILVGILQFVSAPLQLIAAQIDSLGEGLKKIGVISESFGLQDKLNKGISSLADMVFSPADVQAKGEAELAAMEKQLKALENQRAGHQIAINNIDKRAAEERKQAAEKAAAERRVQESQAANSELTEIKSIGDQKLQLATTNAQSLVKIETNKETELSKVVKKGEEERAAMRKQNIALGIQFAAEGLQALSSLNEAFAGQSRKQQERAFKINKAFSIAQALISTYQGVNTQLAVPQDQLTGANFVKAGIILATGIANVAKIAKTKFDGGGGGGGGTGGGSSSVASVGGASVQSGSPTFNPIDTSFLGNRPPQTAQAYVLAGHVSNAQDANAKIKDLRRL